VRLSERSEFAPRRLIRASQGTHNDLNYGQECRVPFLLVPFLWASKEKILVHKGRNTQTNSRLRIKRTHRRGMKTTRPCASTKKKKSRQGHENAG